MSLRHSTKQVSWALQCDGKVRHPDRRSARRSRNGTRGGAGHLTIYRCPWCDSFHLGHSWADPYAAELEDRLRARAEADQAPDIQAAIARALHLAPDEARALLEQLSNTLDE